MKEQQHLDFALINRVCELLEIDDGMAEWIGDKVSAAKKRKAMSDVTSRFGNKLKMKSKGFVPKKPGEKHWAYNGKSRKFGATYPHGTVFARRYCAYQKEATGMESLKM